MIKKIAFFIILPLLIFFTESVSGQDSTAAKPKAKWHKKICITFDNLPAERTYDRADRIRINEGILRALKKHDVLAAGFVIGDNIEWDMQLIADWLADEHTIGVLPYSGQDATELPANLFIDDIERGIDALDSVLTAYNQYSRFFRFPLLQYGETPEKRKEIEEFLKIENIAIAHVSVLSGDFIYNLSFEKVAGGENSRKIAGIRDEYIANILKEIKKAEKLAAEVAGSQIKQIIQFNANRINGMFLDDILSAIERNGYQFITLRDALEDGIYTFPDNYYGNKTISYLERIKLSNYDYFPAVDSGKSED